ncbi:TadE/TadG family type IV pilus assembly protein [Vibrio sp. LaRot3]|uniref:TadE/TadG family type IV pilus assembly protein n=1 Tax=Vibrio sp. LaRot3 TaxID=2998829 RepID=UPI0022CDD214|nr:TadE family protein [Vibrio sp. LaRot3]MDA0148803.1 pilus assembly protein [Vibrio sp. LaRot3]
MKKKQKGVVSVELALGFFAFWLMVAAWAELSFMSYVSAVNDLAVAEASRTAKKDTQDYIDHFYNRLDESDSLWSGLVDKSKFKASVRYVPDMNALNQVNAICEPAGGTQTTECGTPANSAIAIYYISYDFSGIFSYFFDQDTIFGREVIVVQEYERDQFEI